MSEKEANAAEKTVHKCCICESYGVIGPDSPAEFDAGPGDGRVWLHFISGDGVACEPCIVGLFEDARKNTAEQRGHSAIAAVADRLCASKEGLTRSEFEGLIRPLLHPSDFDPLEQTMVESRMAEKRGGRLYAGPELRKPAVPRN